jgi:hypothetical protein
MFTYLHSYFKFGGLYKLNIKQKRLTVAGTDIDEVKRLNEQSGLSYNEVKQLLAVKFIQNKK